MTHARPLLALVLLTLLLPAGARAQMPSCTGDDADGASAAFEEGNRLMAQAIEQAGRRRIDRARELATDALAQFDLQCELGDDSALAERGGALMLMGEAMRSAQSYDAYLRAHPLSSLDARSRRRIESNLQPGIVTIELEGDAASALTLFVDALDFGALPRDVTLRLPLGEHTLEARDADGNTLATGTASLAEGATETSVVFSLPILETTVVPVPVPDRATEGDPEPTPVMGPAPVRTDFTPFYIATGAAAGVFLGAAIGLQVGADDRAQTFNRFCRDPTVPFAGCDSVRSEYDGMFGAAIAGYVLAGLAVAGLVTVAVLDMSQPREHLRITLAPTPDGVSGSIAGSF